MYIISWSMSEIIERLHDRRFAIKSAKDDKTGSGDDISSVFGLL